MKVKIVCDTSIIIDGIISKILEKENFSEIIIPIAVLDELQNQASKGRNVGFIGLNEIKKIREIGEKKGIKIKFSGERPTLEDIKLASSGRIDAIIRDVAKKENAILYTSDYVQALVGEAEGVKVKYFPSQVKTENLKFESFFSKNTLSVHLKEKCYPLAKVGYPGNFELVKIRDTILTAEELEEMIKEIYDAVRISEDSTIEINRSGATVIQFKDYRISIARPPFSDGIEITIVRPIVKLTLEDYKLSEKLKKRLEERSEGIIIAGSPGSGKTSFASALAEFYKSKGKIVKTMESPRDMQVSEEITQYTALEGDFEKTADILLLVRPDYVIFDEVRKTKDFQIFCDLRLAGIGMVGVVHASNPIDAIQRFLNRVELGMLPHIIDTVIFIKDGKIVKVLTLNITVKIPTGMKEEDLIRPVVEVRDFETEKLEYEIYSYGEENVIIPIKTEKNSGIKKLAEQRIYSLIKRFDPKAEVEIVGENKAIIKVDNKVIPKIIGSGGSVIKSLESILGIYLEVLPKTASLGNEIKFEIEESGNSFVFVFSEEIIGKRVNVYIDNKFLFSATVGKNGKIKVSKESDIGKEIIKAIIESREIKCFV